MGGAVPGKKCEANIHGKNAKGRTREELESCGGGMHLIVVAGGQVQGVDGYEGGHYDERKPRVPAADGLHEAALWPLRRTIMQPH